MPARKPYRKTSIKWSFTFFICGLGLNWKTAFSVIFSQINSLPVTTAWLQFLSWMTESGWPGLPTGKPPTIDYQDYLEGFNKPEIAKEGEICVRYRGKARHPCTGLLYESLFITICEFAYPKKDLIFCIFFPNGDGRAASICPTGLLRSSFNFDDEERIVCLVDFFEQIKATLSV